MQTNKPFTLAEKIKKEIGNRILLCLIALLLVVFGLTIYVISTEFNQIPARINPQLKVLEDFVMNQSLIDNAQTISLKMRDFNEKNSAFQIKWVTNTKPVSNAIQRHFPFSWSYNYPLGELAGVKLGTFQVTGSFLKDAVLIHELLFRLGLLLIFAIILFILLNPLAKKIPDQLFVSPLNRFLDLIDGQDQVETNQKTSSPLPIELAELETRILSLISKAKEYERQQAKVRIGEVVIRVAHDIRSPLTILNIMLSSTVALPEESRILVRNVLNRVNDIANNLLAQHRYRSPQDLADEQDTFPELIYTIVDSMMSEKRLQYRNRDIDFEFYVDEKSYGHFARISALDFKRVLSNLINNSVEAIEKRGRIDVHVYPFSSYICIAINDNGVGISEELEAKISNEGFSSGKPAGNGIGLASSKRLIMSWKGDFFLKSKVGEGTKICISLPTVKSPDWFLSRIELEKEQEVVVLDDDQFIHDVWNTRFLNEKIGMLPEKIKHFYKADVLIEAYPTLSPDAFFLVDYELQGSTLTGLDVIRKLFLGSRAALVTSRDDEPELRAQCQTLGIRLLPKAFANYVPLSLLDGEIKIPIKSP